EAQELAQRALLPFDGEGAEAEHDDQQRREHLEDPCRRQSAEALEACGVLRRAEFGLALPVRPQPDRGADERIDAGIDHAQWRLWLEHVHPLVCSGVRMARALL